MSQSKPGAFAKAVTKSDTVSIDFEGKAYATRGLYVGSGGDISVEMAGSDEKGKGLDDATVTFVAVPTGTLMPIRCTRVNSTGTGASSMVAIW